MRRELVTLNVRDWHHLFSPCPCVGKTEPKAGKRREGDGREARKGEVGGKQGREG